MPKETKFTLYLMLFLAVAFGFIVWQKLAKKTDVIAELKRHAGELQEQAFGPGSEVDPHGHSQNGENPFDAKPIQTASNNSSPVVQAVSQEPRKLPVPTNLRQSQANPFEEPVVAQKPTGKLPSNPFDGVNSPKQPSKPVQIASAKPPGQNPFPPGSPTPSKNPFPPADVPQKPTQSAANVSPFDKNPGGAFPSATPQQNPPQQNLPPQVAQGNSNRVNPFDGQSEPSPQSPKQGQNPFGDDVPTAPPGAKPGVNPFEGDANFVPVKHSEKPKQGTKSLFPSGDPQPPQQNKQSPFPPAETAKKSPFPDGPPPKTSGRSKMNPFDEIKVSQKPDPDSSALPAPKFHTNPPSVPNPPQKNNGGGFNPFDGQNTPPRPPSNPHFPSTPVNPNPTPNPPPQQHQNPNPKPNPKPNAPAYDPFQQGPQSAPTQKPTRAYRVQMDETYWSISEKIYGSIKYFQALAEFNKYRIPNPKHLRAGMIILVPEAKELERLYAKVIPGAVQKNDPYAAVDSGLFFTKAGAPMYRVDEDDTLSDIAQKHLGRSTRWVEIYNMNQQVLKTADRVKPGMILKLPRDASRVTFDSHTTEIR